ncbi:hypothetical protein RSOLAG22IIIB_08324 [Rhizoctonia solani]|uniref:Uncharacterized protein n=1 Tax=Rhizoctonia solani TaxID=456999 RepID=A0A0K6FSM3_9AGAM|nr:hypothetical protein RSOLAG22IIIB_08324 [Rhizoctonia solani]
MVHTAASTPIKPFPSYYYHYFPAPSSRSIHRSFTSVPDLRAASSSSPPPAGRSSPLSVSPKSRPHEIPSSRTPLPTHDSRRLGKREDERTFSTHDQQYQQSVDAQQRRLRLIAERDATLKRMEERERQAEGKSWYKEAQRSAVETIRKQKEEQRRRVEDDYRRAEEKLRRMAQAQAKEERNEAQKLAAGAARKQAEEQRRRVEEDYRRAEDKLRRIAQAQAQEERKESQRLAAEAARKQEEERRRRVEEDYRRTDEKLLRMAQAQDEEERKKLAHMQRQEREDKRDRPQTRHRAADTSDKSGYRERSCDGRYKNEREFGEQPPKRERTKSEAHERVNKGRARRSKSPSSVVSAWEAYKEGCAELMHAKPPKGKTSGRVTFYDIPWPILGQAASFHDLTNKNISAFLLSPHHSQDKSPKARLRAAILIWHPDKFVQKVLPHIAESHRQAVSAGVEIVARIVTELISSQSN